MLRNHALTLAACATLLLACASSTAQTRADGPQAPASAQTIAHKLEVRHAEDLPERDDLAKFPDAEASLLWIAAHDDKMVVRVRALDLLRLYPSKESLQALMDLTAQDKTHPTVLAAAMRGLEPHSDKAEVLAVLTRALRHPDQRVAVAAARSLSASPAHAELLKAEAADPKVHQRVRELLDSGELAAP